MTIGEMFTEKELRKAFKIMERYFLLSALDGDAPEPLNDTLLREVVTPEVMRRIDDKTGQQNHAGYFCYVLQYAYTQSQGRMPEG